MRWVRGSTRQLARGLLFESGTVQEGLSFAFACRPRCWAYGETHRNFCTRKLQRTSKVALTGAPNAGKSTLVNALCGRKVSAVSKKTNTTHRNTLGYFQEGSVQVLLYDTPGLVGRRYVLVDANPLS